ncbi:MAG: hypothetical protein R3B94_09245 [Hyphomonas sp.]
MNIQLDEKFYRHRMVSLAPDQLIIRMSELEAMLNRILENARSNHVEDMFEAGIDQQIVQALKDCGHDLWSWDFDGENVERWSYDYTSDQSRSLVLDVHRRWKVRCDWVERIPGSEGRRFIMGVCDPDFDEDPWSR